MLLRGLEITRLPGIEPGFELAGLEPGVTVISGPNASGKSSLVRALAYLLGPPVKGDPEQLVLRACFEAEGSELTVERTGQAISWFQAGRSVKRPALPEGQELFFYRLQLEHLLQAEGPDQQFLAEVKRQLFGGFDVDRLRRLPDLQTPSRGLRNSWRQMLNAQGEARRVAEDYRHLLEQQQGLPERQRRLEELERQVQLRPALEQAQELLQQLEEKSQLESRLQAFPPGMERLRGDELEVLGKLEQQAQELARQRQQQELARDEAEKRLQETGLAAAELDQALLDEQRERLHRLEQLLEKQARHLDELRACEIREQELTGKLPDADNHHRFSPAALEQARELAGRLHELELQQQQLLLARPEADAAPPPASEVDRQRDGLRALEAWLAATAAAGSRKTGWAASLLLLVGLLVLVVQAVTTTDYRLLLGAGLAGAGAALLWWLRSGGRRRALARWAETRLADPVSWNPAGVEARAEQLRQQLEQWRQQRQRAEQAEQAERRLQQVREQLQRLEPERRRLAEQVGCDPGRTLEFTAMVQMLERYHQVRDERARATASCENLERQAGEQRRALTEFLNRWQQLPSDDTPESLRAALERLAERQRRADSARQEVAACRRDLAALAARRQDNERQVRELFQRVGLEPERREELFERLRTLPDWSDCQRKLVKVQGAIAVLEKRLADRPQLLELARRRDAATLAARLEECHRAEAQARQTSEELTATRTRLEAAGRDLRLEQARAAEQQARQELEQAVRAEELAAAGTMLLDDIEREFESEQQPRVLQRARDYLRLFTNYACDLEFSRGDGGLLARECRQPGQPLRRLEELSTGTRMQLLLALRLAWISRLEAGREPLPLWLDEALTTSDPERFAAVARSLGELAEQEGRQVFYLTARPEEADWWQRVTQNRPHHIELDQVRGLEPPPGGGYRLSAPRSLPAPAGRDAEQYARLLAVAPIKPARGVAAVHPFHLLRDDLELLHRLLDTWRTDSLGQLENLLRAEAGRRAIPDERRHLQLRQRLDIARTWQKAWVQGRSEPVEHTILALSGAVSERFLQPVAQLAERLGGDGRALLAELRRGTVKRFSTKKIEELELWLEQHGHLSDARPLDRDGRLARVLSELGGEIPPEEITRVVGWLEAGAAAAEPPTTAPASN